ncbi:MAG: alpha/beta fold hydrolase [Bacteroidota bacterium]
MKKWWIGLILVVITLLLAAVGTLYVKQESLIFRPDKLSDNFVFARGKEVKIAVADDIALHAVLQTTKRSKGVILYLHGNRGTNRRALFQADNFRNNGYDILVLDYRGYGKSDGDIYSERQLYQDVQKVYDYLKRSYREDQIVVIGYSLGTGMASFLAATNHPQRLFLIAPYASMTAMKDKFMPFVPDFLLKYKLNNMSHVARVTCPVTIFHGMADELIPYQMSEQIQAIAPAHVQLKLLEGVSHRGIIFNDVLRLEVARQLE